MGKSYLLLAKLTLFIISLLSYGQDEIELNLPTRKVPPPNVNHEEMLQEDLMKLRKNKAIRQKSFKKPKRPYSSYRDKELNKEAKKDKKVEENV